MGKPIISIICNAYNHEKYIKDALDGFLMQEVSVPFEILIHDDASDDETASIIRQYHKKFPDIIKPIYQSVNQYSAGVLITYEIQMPRAQGKYIAFCEGDDYWTDKNKLQIQYDFMERHKEYTGCCHAYNMVNKDKELISERFDFDDNCDLKLEHLVGNQLEVPQFATWFVRKNIFDNFDGKFLGRNCNDMVMRIFCFTHGKLRYINRDMSCYRRFSEGSWTARNNSKSKMSEQIKSYIPFFENLDEYLNYEYHELIVQQIDDRKFQSFILDDNYREAVRCASYTKQPLSKRLYIRVGCAFPGLIKFLKEAKRHL